MEINLVFWASLIIANIYISDILDDVETIKYFLGASWLFMAVLTIIFN